MKTLYLDEGDNISLELHHRIAQKLQKDPFLISVAKNNISRWLSVDRSRSYKIAIQEWSEKINSLSLDDLIHEMLREDDEGQRLRSNSPFGGILSESERLEVLELVHAAT